MHLLNFVRIKFIDLFSISLHRLRDIVRWHFGRLSSWTLEVVGLAYCLPSVLASTSCTWLFVKVLLGWFILSLIVLDCSWACSWGWREIWKLLLLIQVLLIVWFVKKGLSLRCEPILINLDFNRVLLSLYYFSLPGTFQLLYKLDRLLTGDLIFINIIRWLIINHFIKVFALFSLVGLFFGVTFPIFLRLVEVAVFIVQIFVQKLSVKWLNFILRLLLLFLFLDHLHLFRLLLKGLWIWRLWNLEKFRFLLFDWLSS